ncbi:TetR family transcriptional regulator [Delftia sp. BR1]|nr:TetR family transcriptional regulator [Delftia sp. BR1]
MAGLNDGRKYILARRTKEDAFATRNSLLDAAEQVFYEQGVARASLNEIAQRAGATRGAVYWHFKDKLDLFYAMLDRVTLPLEQAAQGDCEDDSECDALEYVRRLMAVVFGRIADDDSTRRVFEILLLKVEYVGELMPVQERNRAALDSFSSRLELALCAAAESHAVTMPMSAHQASIALCAMFDGLLQSWLLGRAFDLKHVGAQAVDVCLRGLGFAVSEAPAQ